MYTVLLNVSMVSQVKMTERLNELENWCLANVAKMRVALLIAVRETRARAFIHGPHMPCLFRQAAHNDNEGLVLTEQCADVNATTGATA